ncbi:hypothetical protein P5Z58_02000 [Limosilactobacillus mucosae]|nr:hypothetical protein [Limosilactobacillus mucosae]
MKIAVIKGQLDNEGYYVPELHTVFVDEKEGDLNTIKALLKEGEDE